MKGMEGGGGGERETQWPDPDFYPSRIPDLGSRIQKQVEKRGVKKNLLPTVYTFLLKLTPPPLYRDIVKFLLSSHVQVRTGNRGK
jgi:hypothetical protein